MQKHAYSFSRQYQTLFDPLPVSPEEALYFDRRSIELPYAEDFPKLHYHDRYEIGICENGEGLFLSEGEFFSVSKGDLIFIAPGRYHYSRSLDPNKLCTCRFAYLSSESVKCLLASLPFGEDQKETMLKNAVKSVPTVISASEHPQATQLLSEIMDACTSSASDSAALAVLKLTVFLFEIQRWFDHAPFISSAMQASDDAVAKISEYLALHYNSFESARELASKCHLSESQLRRRFLAIYGIPPIAYRNFLRCKIAAELLVRTRLSISEIAERIGYTAPSDFYRAFKKNYGMSPSAYRTSHTV